MRVHDQALRIKQFNKIDNIVPAHSLGITFQGKTCYPFIPLTRAGLRGLVNTLCAQERL